MLTATLSGPGATRSPGRAKTPSEIDRAKIARLAFPDTPAAHARALLSGERATAFIRHHGYLRADGRLTLGREQARRLRAHLDPSWPPPADAGTYSRRHVQLRMEVSARRHATATRESRMASDIEEFTLLRAASLLYAPSSAMPWPQTPAELTETIDRHLVPTIHRSARVGESDVHAMVGEFAATTPAALARLCGTSNLPTADTTLAQVWFSCARSITSLWHELGTTRFDSAVSTLLAVLPDGPGEGLAEALEEVRAQ